LPRYARNDKKIKNIIPGCSIVAVRVHGVHIAAVRFRAARQFMKKMYIVLLLVLFIVPVNFLKAESLAKRLSGRVLLQVESKGEAWYVSPDNLLRIFLGKPQDAFNLMRKQGVGMSNDNLKKIPIGIITSGNDKDKDGLPDNLEIAIGLNANSQDSDKDGFNDKDEIARNYNPAGQGRLPIDNLFALKYKGQILLQVETHGEAWYINPVNNKRYYLGRPEDAFAIMRSLGLGIKNIELEEIFSLTPNYELATFEDRIFNLINAEREKNSLPALILNKDMSLVAREHSRNLADENLSLTDFNKACDYPIIHHEGFIFGAYSQNRLNNRGIFYFSKSGENIALIPGETIKTFYFSDDEKSGIDDCANRRESLDNKYTWLLEKEKDATQKLAIVKNEITNRQEVSKQEKAVTIASIIWDSEEKVAQKTIKGWMDSPGHKANILDSEYDETGIGSAYVNGYVITTQVFIKRADCGFKSGFCCQKEGYYPYCYKPFNCQDEKCQ
jgi:uncharacterized protein YkwD